MLSYPNKNSHYKNKTVFGPSYLYDGIVIPGRTVFKLKWAPGGRLNIEMSSYQYGDSHVKDKTVSPTVLSLTWESSYLGKTVFILRRGPGFCCSPGSVNATTYIRVARLPARLPCDVIDEYANLTGRNMRCFSEYSASRFILNDRKYSLAKCLTSTDIAVNTLRPRQNGRQGPITIFEHWIR